jgi:hypothetical protein
MEQAKEEASGGPVITGRHWPVSLRVRLAVPDEFTDPATRGEGAEHERVLPATRLGRSSRRQAGLRDKLARAGYLTHREDTLLGGLAVASA